MRCTTRGLCACSWNFFLAFWWLKCTSLTLANIQTFAFINIDRLISNQPCLRWLLADLLKKILGHKILHLFLIFFCRKCNFFMHLIITIIVFITFAIFHYFHMMYFVYLVIFIFIKSDVKTYLQFFFFLWCTKLSFYLIQWNINNAYTWIKLLYRCC